MKLEKIKRWASCVRPWKALILCGPGGAEQQQQQQRKTGGKSTSGSDGIPSLPLRRVTFGTKSPVIWAVLSGTGRLTEAKYSQPAKSTAHVGWGHSGMTHSYLHRETGTHRHTKYILYTNFHKYITSVRLRCTNLQKLQGNVRWLRQRKQIPCSNSHTLSSRAHFSLRDRWKCSWWDYLSGCLSLVTDSERVGVLCYHLPSGQRARPNKTFYSLFL